MVEWYRVEMLCCEEMLFDKINRTTDTSGSTKLERKINDSRIRKRGSNLIIALVEIPQYNRIGGYSQILQAVNDNQDDSIANHLLQFARKNQYI